MEWIVAGLTFGFLGSFHCIGMCGPLALALPGQDQSNYSLLASRLAYNIGRVMTYSTLGLTVGLISKMIAISGFQRWLSIGIGVLILLGMTITTLRRQINRWKTLPSKLIKKATSPIKSLFRDGSITSLFLIGILNGLLPCGFVYLALTTALTTGGAIESVYFMAGFGFGTFPAMLGMSLAGSLISVSLRRQLQKISPYFIVLVAVLLIMRGLDLGIPFLSPNL